MNTFVYFNTLNLPPCPGLKQHNFWEIFHVWHGFSGRYCHTLSRQGGDCDARSLIIPQVIHEHRITPTPIFLLTHTHTHTCTRAHTHTRTHTCTHVHTDTHNTHHTNSTQTYTDHTYIRTHTQPYTIWTPGSKCHSVTQLSRPRYSPCQGGAVFVHMYIFHNECCACCVIHVAHVTFQI